MIEVADYVEEIMDTVVEDGLVEEDAEAVSEVGNLDVDNVVDKPDLEDVELYNVDVEQDVFLDVELGVQGVVDVECEVVVVEGT